MVEPSESPPESGGRRLPRGRLSEAGLPEPVERELGDAIAAELPDLIEIRHDLHAHPGLAFEETHAAGVVERELRRAGVSFAAGIGGTGLVAWLPQEGAEGGSVREATALRADLDALPIQEATGLPHASTVPGRMHACGHDGHTAILIGAARVLARLRRHLPRPAKFLFQPAEETSGGAEKMIEAGALDERTGAIRAGAIFGLHGWPGLPLGTVATRPGPLMASTDTFRISVLGRGGHGSAPQSAVDPIVASAAIVTALQSIVSRNVHPLAPAVLTVGTIRAGDAPNVIPDSAILGGTVRALDDAVAEEVWRRLVEVCESTARAFGAEARVEVTRGAPPLVNDAAAARFLLEVARAWRGAESATILESPVMASEDFALYCTQIPACFFFLGLGRSDDRRRGGLHTRTFDFPDEAVSVGVEILCRLALAAG